MKFINILHLHYVQKIYIYVYIYIYAHRLLIVKKRGETPANTSCMPISIRSRSQASLRDNCIRASRSKRWKALHRDGEPS